MGIQWCKWSFSEMGDNCLEVASFQGSVLVRESDDPCVVLGSTPTAPRALLIAVANKGFDRPV
ncbi:DUF397 domain-containing protein [Streptomyces klenkii]|uniref:DUF397 domain-containing protein n=1 Tax=Streptomyces klenkii TaxID=1420899 RepID=UPI0033F6533E